MFDELHDNALKAETKYNNKYIEITGRLSTIDSDGMYISLERTDEVITFDSVLCSLKNDTQRNQVMEMSRGNIVTLRGKIISIGEIIGYSLVIDEIVSW